MSKPANTTPAKLQTWMQARKRHHLSHAQVQMTRELGMNAAELGSIDNHRGETGSPRLSSRSESEPDSFSSREPRGRS
jgi:hypothetical protein